MSNETIYMKLPRNARLKQQTVMLADVAKIESTDEKIAEKVRDIVLYVFPEGQSGKRNQKNQRVLSALKIIALIHEKLPNLQIENIGETDCILEYVPVEESQMAATIKTIILCIIIFFGSAFTIMAFNNDVGVSDIFDKLYKQVIGRESSGYTILEITYSIGLSIGIIVFYNHVSHKKLTKDPTPVEVELRKYENDMDMTMIENSSREGNNIDVD